MKVLKNMTELSNTNATLSENEFANLSVAEIRAGLAKKKFSATELTKAYIAQVEKADNSVKAYLEVTKSPALEAAADVDGKIAAGEFESLGALAGVPCAYKDNMNMQGTHTTCASHMLENYVSPYTATCVQKTLDAHAIPLGKTNMDEFAFGSSTETSAFGNTNNPWNCECVPGGSSGGSAAAVAGGMACVALGSDTGGSIRQPASFCGVVGVKPTYGTVSRYGVVAFGSSLDQVGPFARSVADAAYVMDAICGRDALDCTSQSVAPKFVDATAQSISGMRIGIVPAFMQAKGLSDEVSSRISEVAKKLEGAGASLVEVDLPHVDAAISAYYVLGPCEAFSNLARFDSVRYGFCDAGHKDLGSQYEASRSAGFGAEVRRRIMLGSYLLSAGVYEKYYYPAQQVRTLITQDYAKAFENCDAILAPTSPTTAFKHGEVADPVTMYLSDVFTISINIAGNGGMSVPVGVSETSGMPIGAQLISPQFKDENMFRAAAAVENIYGSLGVAPAFGGRKAGA